MILLVQCPFSDCGWNKQILKGRANTVLCSQETFPASYGLQDVLSQQDVSQSLTDQSQPLNVLLCHLGLG